MITFENILQMRQEDLKRELKRLLCKQGYEVVSTNAIEMIVRRIMAEESSKPIVDGQISPIPAQKYVNSELIDFNDGIDLLGEDSIAAIKNTMAGFRR